MEAREYLKLATEETEAGELIEQNNLTEAIVKMLENYALIRVKNCSIPNVIVSSPKIHIVDIDGDIIESLNIMSHAEKLRDAINQNPESIAHHYQVMIRDER